MAKIRKPERGPAPREKTEREVKLAQALRANLRRRKGATPAPAPKKD